MAGMTAFVSAAEARAHIKKLRKSGVSRRTIRDQSGIAMTTLNPIIHGERKRIFRRTHDRILNLTAPLPTNLPKRYYLDRVHALMALGYTETYLANRLGHKHLSMKTTEVRYTTMVKLCELAREIGDTPGPSKLNRSRLAKRGFWVPAMYDEDDFFNPLTDLNPPRPGQRRRHEMARAA